jgi:hypothetical protein
LILAVPQYVECEDLYPDEILDLFGIPTNSVTDSVSLKHYPSASVSSDVKVDSPERHQPGNPYLELFTSVLPVILRC